MNFDDLLKDAWQGEPGSSAMPDLTRRVHRQRRRLLLQRAVEVVLTVVAVLVFGQALVTGHATPAHWLLMPFYVVFLPIVWGIALRAPRRRGEDVTERVRTYASLRLSHLRVTLRDLWLARATGWALLGYAAAANVGVWVLADTHWRSTGLVLLISAVAWLGATLWVSRMLRRRLLREYRSVRRLTGA